MDALTVPVGVPLVLDDQVLLVDGLQQRRGQGLQVRDGLRRGRQAAALLLQEHLLDYRRGGGVTRRGRRYFTQEPLGEPDPSARDGARSAAKGGSL